MIFAPKHITFIVIFLLLLSGCGKNGNGSRSASAPLKGFEIGVSPSPAIFENKFIFSAEGSPEATIYYSLRPFETVGEATAFTTDLVFMPPVTIYLRSLVNSKLGPEQSFEYKTKNNSSDAQAHGVFQRFPDSRKQLRDIPKMTSKKFVPEPNLPVVKIKKITIDGDLNEWPSTLRSVVNDSEIDMPLAQGSADIRKFYVYEDETNFYFGVETRIKSQSVNGIAYGFDMGNSNIDFDSFGSGVDYLYRLEIREDRVTLFDRSNEDEDPKKLKVATNLLEGSIGKNVEVRVAKKAVPNLKPVTHLAFQALAGELINDNYIVDYSPTLFMRSPFQMNRLTTTTINKKPLLIDFNINPEVSQLGVVDKILAMSKSFVDAVETFTQIPLFELGTLPLFYASSDENGFSGLNASDRGVLTTRVVSSTAIEQAHVLVHEFAHFQNAISSQISKLWLREGFSDWSSENILYDYFPTKAVYDYMKKIRYGNYFSYSPTKRRDFALDEWDISSHYPGYEKSLMFMNVLAKEVGRANLLEALRAGVNFKVDSKSMQKFLEFKTGKSLQKLFDTWVYKTNEDDIVMNYYQDSDKDGLLNFDELTLGLNPDLIDSDGDGYLDGEEVFRNRDPRISQIDDSLFKGQTIILADAENFKVSSLMRFATPTPVENIFYSFDPSPSAATLKYKTPLLLRAPYRVQVGVENEPMIILEQPLYNEFGQIVNTVAPSEPYLSVTPRNTANLSPNVEIGGNAQRDFEHDIPADFAAYDIKDMRTIFSSSKTTFELLTVAPPDPLSVYGRYEITLRTSQFTEGATYNNRNYVIRIDGGVSTLLKIDNGRTVAADTFPFQIQTQFKTDRLSVTLSNDLIKEWLEADYEKNVCSATNITLETDYVFNDIVQCQVVGLVEFSAATAKVPGYAGIGEHVFELYTMPANISEANRAYLLKLGASAIEQFAKILTNPLLDRHHWAMHYVQNNKGFSEYNTAKDVGTYLNVRNNIDPITRDQLFVQQLAQLYVSDIPRNDILKKYWVKEALVQWMAMTSLYYLLPTQEVNQVYHGWANFYLCAINPLCGNGPTSVIPLNDINNASQLNEVVTGKIMTFVNYLNTLVGTEVMSKVFSHFVNYIPSTEEFKKLVILYAPTKSSEIEKIWAQWVMADIDTMTRLEFVKSLENNELFKYEAESLKGLNVDPKNYFD